MSGSIQNNHFEEFVSNVPSSKMIYLNLGYLKENDSFDWMEEKDKGQKYAANLTRFVLSQIDLTGKRVLEVGCGRGGNCSYMARYTNAKEIVGLDFCKGHIDLCKKTHLFDNVSFYHGDAQDLPFIDNEFDVVINIESSHCYPNLIKFYQEAFRVLKDGGDFCYADVVASQRLQNRYRKPGGKYHFIQSDFMARDEGEREDLLRQAGFKLGEFVDISKEVTRALEQKEELKNFLQSMTDEKSQPFVEGMIQCINTDLCEAFQKGDLYYHFWYLQKPALVMV